MSYDAATDKSLHRAHAEDTREQILVAARDLFSKRGYAPTSVDDLARASGVTSGALYHHFGSKQGLFAELAERVAAEVAAEAAAATVQSPNHWAALEAGIDAVLDACCRPAVRMVYNEAQIVLGLPAWEKIEQRTAGGTLAGLLGELIDAGEIARWRLDLLTPMVKATIVNAAMTVTSAADPKKARTQVGQIVRSLIGGLREAKPRRRRRSKT